MTTPEIIAGLVLAVIAAAIVAAGLNTAVIVCVVVALAIYFGAVTRRRPTA